MKFSIIVNPIADIKPPSKVEQHRGDEEELEDVGDSTPCKGRAERHVNSVPWFPSESTERKNKPN